MSDALTKQAKHGLKEAIARTANGRKGEERLVSKAVGGVVSFCVRRPAGKIAASAFSPSKLIEAIQMGLPVWELGDLQTMLDVPMERLVPMLGMSKATLHRRKAGGKLAPAESDRVVRFARLMGKAVEVMESEDNARQWLTSPQLGLGGAIPLDYARTEVGAREVEDLLGRIEYGVYS
ncbi:MAG TPA: antitoxin Xre/MbcA/ParS toxin-binding domain-containing protein [Candidatus Acidoferrum sp.]|nr:antitoxin Xre/MbcA/ParS toxin-binding domain-containing protein [Candidatus Acidoferrum sp.]